MSPEICDHLPQRFFTLTSRLKYAPFSSYPLLPPPVSSPRWQKIIIYLVKNSGEYLVRMYLVRMYLLMNGFIFVR